MRKPVPFLLLLLLLPLTRAWAETTAPATIEGAITLTAEETIEFILSEPTLVVIDSRKEEEYAKGHIEGAVNLPDIIMTTEALAQKVNGYDTPLLFYCNGVRCLRSRNAISKAREWGYRNLFWFRGGWLEWLEKQLPITR